MYARIQINSYFFSGIINATQIELWWKNIVEIQTKISLAETSRCQKLFYDIIKKTKCLMAKIMKIKGKKITTTPKIDTEKEKENLSQYLLLYLILCLEFFTVFNTGASQII